jgi:hypothetical protein
MTLSVSLLLCASISASAAADPLRATPATLDELLSRAKGGETIVLTAGEFQDVKVEGRHYDPAVTLDARAATLTAWQLKDVSGLHFRGGRYRPGPPITNPKTGEPLYGGAFQLKDVQDIEVTDAVFQGPGQADAKTSGVYGDGYGLVVTRGSKVVFAQNTYSGFKVGVVISQTDGFRVADSEFTAMRSDGMDIANSHNGLVEGNHCSGTVVRSKEHPDCIQMWSRPPGPPTSDIVIRKNRVEGETQGISLFNHVRDGVDDGGFDRIRIEDNDVRIAATQGIAIVAGRGSILRNNHVKTEPDEGYRASINIKDGDVQRCGNVVEPGGGKPGVVDPKC